MYVHHRQYVCTRDGARGRGPFRGTPHSGATLGALLTRMLDPFVQRNGLGLIYRPKAVFRYRGSEVEPDLMVRGRAPEPIGNDWASAPTPVLVVEVISPSTWRRDRDTKRDFYVSSGIPEYWFVDPDARSITRVRPGEEDVTTHDRLVWAPTACTEELSIDVAHLFAESGRPN